MKHIIRILFLIFALTRLSTAQIWAPEGINMPGAWNSWLNPPSGTPALASSTQITNGKVTLITTGIRRYHTTIKAADAGGDVVGGTHNWLFTSGPAGSPWNNKWGGVTVSMNTIQGYIYDYKYDNSITVTNGKWYTVNFRDAGYGNTDAIFMETSGEPVTVLYAYDNFKQSYLDLDVNIKLSGTPSEEEKVFLRYTTDAWATSSIVKASGSGNAYIATIPAGAVTAKDNEYYIFTSTIDNPTPELADMYSISIGNNNGANYQVIHKYLELKASNVQSSLWGPFMFETKNGVYSCAHEDCGTPGVRLNLAYSLMEWSDSVRLNKAPVECFDCSGATGSGFVTTTQCLSESTNLLADTSNISFFLQPGDLVSFINACPDRKDYRTYAGFGGYIKKSGVQKIAFSSYRFDLIVNYSTGITGSGWAQIDIVNSDPQWVAEFDPYGSGQVLFDLSSFSQLIQQCYGNYDIAFKIKPSQISQYQSFGRLTTQGGSIDESLYFPDSHISFNFTSATWGNAGGNGVFVNAIMTNPSGTIPAGISALSRMYWHLGSGLQSFNTNINFDLSHVSGIFDYSALRILKRDSTNGEWYIWNDFTLIDSLHIRANNVISFSDWAIGSLYDPLPVELETFNGVLDNGFAVLRWQTATEVSNSGFEIQRKLSSMTDWNKVGFVAGAGNSSSPKTYLFSDKIPGNGCYQYRLKQVDNDGSFSYSKIVEIQANRPTRFELTQNYPNPFNPSTTIRFSLDKSTYAKLTVYNTLGQEVAKLVDGYVEAGDHSVQFKSQGLASGMYIYELNTAGARAYKKLVINK